VEVDALKSAGAKQVGDKPAAAQADSEHMLYQLRYRPEEARFSSTARVGLRQWTEVKFCLLENYTVIRKKAPTFVFWHNS